MSQLSHHEDDPSCKGTGCKACRTIQLRAVQAVQQLQPHQPGHDGLGAEQSHGETQLHN